jgi:bacterioferritin
VRPSSTSQTHGYAVVGRVLEVFGVCGKCRSKSRAQRHDLSAMDRLEGGKLGRPGRRVATICGHSSQPPLVRSAEWGAISHAGERGFQQGSAVSSQPTGSVVLVRAWLKTAVNSRSRASTRRWGRIVQRMKGNPSVIAMLNTRLAAELSSMDLYLLQGRMLHDWGYGKLSERLVHESGDERQHADLLIQRILFLEGVPDMTKRLNLTVGTNPEEMFKGDLQYEYEVANGLNEGIALCEQARDSGTRKVLQQLLSDTEDDHILWLETQLRLIASLGLQAYLAEQL